MIARRFTLFFVTLCCLVALAGESFAQAASGQWRVTYQWHDGARQMGQYDVSLNEDGFWRNSLNETGSWRLNEDYLFIRYDEYPHTEYRGTLSGESITGVIVNQRGENGSFTMSRIGAQAPVSLQSIVGEWRLDGLRWRFSLRGDTLIWETNEDNAGWTVRTEQRARITSAGYIGFDPIEGNAFEIGGDRLYLHYDSDSPTERQAEFVRARGGAKSLTLAAH